MGKIDPMDRMLSRLPSEAPAETLAARIVWKVRARHRRQQSLRWGASLVLAASGLWLAMPLAFSLPASVQLPGSGLTVLWDWVQAALTDASTRLVSVWNGLNGIHNGVAAPITATAWLGLAILALSVLLVVGQLLPHRLDTLREGVSVK